MIEKLFEGKVGKAYKEEEIIWLVKEGERRYESKVPPGYADEKKNGLSKYGDLIMWKQIVDRAREVKQDVLLITDESKEVHDWWAEDRDRINDQKVPRRELIKEMKENAGVRFFMYDSKDFLQEAKRRWNARITNEAIEDVQEDNRTNVRKVRLSEDETRFFQEMINPMSSVLKEITNPFSIIASTYRQALQQVEQLPLDDISKKLEYATKKMQVFEDTFSRSLTKVDSYDQDDSTRGKD